MVYKYVIDDSAVVDGSRGDSNEEISLYPPESLIESW